MDYEELLEDNLYFNPRNKGRKCCVCGEALLDHNYYSFRPPRLWCIPCGDVYLVKQFPAYPPATWTKERWKTAKERAKNAIQER